MHRSDLAGHDDVRSIQARAEFVVAHLLPGLFKLGSHGLRQLRRSHTSSLVTDFAYGHPRTVDPAFRVKNKTGTGGQRLGVYRIHGHLCSFGK